MHSYLKTQLLKLSLVLFVFAGLTAIFGSSQSTHAQFGGGLPIIPTLYVVTFNPSSINMTVNGTVTLAPMTNDTLLNFTVSQGGGTLISLSATTTSYTAPATAGVYYVTAMTTTGTVHVSGILTIHVSNQNPPITVSINHTGSGLSIPTASSTIITATTNDLQGVTWSVSAGGGTIDANTGAYTAPLTPGTYTVTATSVTDGSLIFSTLNVSVTQAVDVNTPVTSIEISPATATTSASSTFQFQAIINGESTTTVTWTVPRHYCIEGVSINQCNPNTGSINALGLYTAPDGNGTYTIYATSLADHTKVASSTITVVNGYDYVGGGGLHLIVTQFGSSGPYIPSSLTLSTTSISIATGETFEFNVRADSSSPVVWTLVEGALAGSISRLGVYTASYNPGNYNLLVTNSYATTTATIKVVQGLKFPVSISISPASVTLSRERLSTTTLTQQFSAEVLNASSTAVSWNVVENNGGSINSSGLYTAPFTTATTSLFHVVATSVAEPSKTATSTVTIILHNPKPVLAAVKEPVLAKELKAIAVNDVATSTATSSVATTSVVAETRPQSTPTFASRATEQAIVVVQRFADAANTTADAIKTPQGSTIVNTVSTAGVVTGSAWTFTSLMASPLFASPLATSEIFFVPLRLWGLALSFLGLKRRNRPWGTVYDSVTKLPIDPAVVTLYDSSGKKVTMSITDLDGRFGFMVPKGTYHMTVQKTNYAFPSKKLTGKTDDELYSNLYFGETIEVGDEGSVIYKNIPMDPQKFDWNEFAKNKMGVMQFHSLSERFNAKASNIIFWLGFAVGLVSVFVIPHVYSVTILSLYVVLIVLRVSGTHRKHSGTITDSQNHPLSFATISVISKDLQRELFKKVADQYGRYYALVPKGEYEIKVSRKNIDESYTEVYDGKVNAKGGVINGSIKV